MVLLPSSWRCLQPKVFPRIFYWGEVGSKFWAFVCLKAPMTIHFNNTLTQVQAGKREKGENLGQVPEMGGGAWHWLVGWGTHPLCPLFRHSCLQLHWITRAAECRACSNLGPVLRAESKQFSNDNPSRPVSISHLWRNMLPWSLLILRGCNANHSTKSAIMKLNSLPSQ